MKKVMLSLGLLMAVAGAANAQATFGVKAGGSLTTVNQKGDDDSKYKFGAHGGVFANFGISDMFSIQPELLFSMKGSKSEETTTIGGTTYTSKGTQSLNYIDIPVMVKVSTGGDNNGLFFEAGPQLGILLSAKNEVEVTGAASTNTDIKDLLNTVDFGYGVGLGYQVESGPLVGLRYNGGITDIVKDNTGNAARNDAFQLYVGYRFGGK